MNSQETTQVITLLAGNYDKIAEKTKEQKQLMINTWQECLGDLDYNLVLQAVKRTIITSPYPPTIHEIRKNAIELVTPTEANSLDYWNECYKMICNGAYMTEEQFRQHSLICQKFLGSTKQLKEYATNTNFNFDVVRSNFFKQYDIIIQREKENKLLPESMKELQQQLVSKFDIKQIGE